MSYHYMAEFIGEGQNDDKTYWPHDHSKERFTPAEVWKIALADGRARWASQITVTEVRHESTQIARPDGLEDHPGVEEGPMTEEDALAFAEYMKRTFGEGAD